MGIFGSKKPGGDLEIDVEKVPMKGPSLSDMGSRRAAKGIMAALEAHDVGALDRALKAHYAACEGDGGADEATEGDGE